VLEAQLADGRPFLAGDRPGLADVQAHPFLWLARGGFPELAAQLVEGFARLQEWEQVMTGVGEGTRTAITAQQGLAAARAASPVTAPEVDPADAQGLRLGQRVEVSPDDTRRGAVQGEVVVAAPNRIALRRVHEALGEVVVHFPRLGYRVRPL